MKTIITVKDPSRWTLFLLEWEQNLHEADTTVKSWIQIRKPILSFGWILSSPHQKVQTQFVIEYDREIATSYLQKENSFRVSFSFGPSAIRSSAFCHVFHSRLLSICLRDESRSCGEDFARIAGILGSLVWRAASCAVLQFSPFSWREKWMSRVLIRRMTRWIFSSRGNLISLGPNLRIHKNVIYFLSEKGHLCSFGADKMLRFSCRTLSVTLPENWIRVRVMRSRWKLLCPLYQIRLT